MAAQKIPAFSEVGKATKDLLYGDREGAFLFEKQAKISTKTADGVEFTLLNKFRNDKVEQEVTGSYKTDKYAIKASVNPAGKIITTLTLTNPVPNLTLGISGALPDQSSAKLTIDYAVPNLTLKSVASLTSNPTVNVAATTGYKGGVFGAAGLYDSKSGTLTSWEGAAGYTSLDYQVAASYNNSDLLKLAFTHNVDRTASVGAEVSKKVSDTADSPTNFVVGYSKRLAGGSLAKLRLDNAGLASLLYSADIQPNTRVTHSVQFNATNPNAPPKYGFALDLKA